MSCETRMARSFGTVREDGSKEGVRYSSSGSETEAMAHLLFCVYSGELVNFFILACALRLLQPEGKEDSRRKPSKEAISK